MLDNLDKFNNPQFGSATANFGMTPQQAGVNYNPAMQAEINAAALKDAANDNFIANRVNAFSEVDPMTQLGVAAPVWLAMNLAMDKYLKYCGGEYNKSIPGRIGNFGDKVSHFFTDNRVGRFLNEQMGKGKRGLKKTVYDNSALLRAFDQTPSKPELTLVKHQFEGIKGQTLTDCTNAWEAFVEKSVKSAKDLDCYGATKGDIQRVENLLKNAATSAEKKLILQTEEFRLLNPSVSSSEIHGFQYNATPEARAKILKELKLKAAGFTDAAEYELIKKNAIKYPEKVLNILSRAKKNMFARIDWSDGNALKSAGGHIAGRKVAFSQQFNLIQSSLGMQNTMHSTKFGRFLAKLSNQLMEGSTSRISGGKMMAFMQAYFLAEALIMANKQETTGDKLKSAAERITELIGFFVFMPPSIKLMHKIGGLQYSGMTPEQIENYRAAVKEFNEKVVNCMFKDKKAYKAARKELRAKFRPKTKNPFVWLARKTADVITVGLEQVRPYTKHKQKQVNLCISEILKSPKQYIKNIGPRLKDFACNPKYWLKQMAGYPVRFALPMLVFIPFFNKIAVKACHAVVGKPKYSILDQDKIEEQQKQQEEQAQQMQALMQKQAAAQQAQASAIPVTAASAASTTNLLNKYKNPEPKPAQISSTGSLLNKPAAESKKPEELPEYKRTYTYVPSPDAAKVKPQDATEAEKALKRADKAEKDAIKVLGGNFNV